METALTGAAVSPSSGREGRLTPQHQQQLLASVSPPPPNLPASLVAVSPSHEVSTTGVALLHQELLVYVLQRCCQLPPAASPEPAATVGPCSVRGRAPTSAAAATAAALPVLHSCGYRVGTRVAERLTLKCCRMPEQRECVKFICKDLWHFFFQKQADRLQTNRRGGYVVHDTNLPWLRRVYPAAATAAAAAPATAAATGTAAAAKQGSGETQQQQLLLQLQLQQQRDEMLRAAASQPQLHVAFVCGAIRGALATLGLEATVTADAQRPPSCAFQIRISS